MELVLIVRRLFHRCKLVHADLSEYNILYHQNHLYIIDVSQSVEHDHPSAFDFLRNDIKNVEDFFGRLGVHCLGLRRCFEFVTREQLAPEPQELPQAMEEIDRLEGRILSQWLEQREEPRDDGFPGSGEAAHEDSVFMRSFIPRTLNEVYDPERDVEKLAKGQGDELIYADTIGIVRPTSAITLEDENGEDIQPPTEGTVKQRILAGSTVPASSTPSTKVRFAASAPEKDRADQEDINTSTAEVKNMVKDESGEDESGSDKDDEDEEEGPDNESEQHKEGWIEKKPKGHRHEDREAKKVSSWLVLNSPTLGALFTFSSNSLLLLRLSELLFSCIFLASPLHHYIQWEGPIYSSVRAAITIETIEMATLYQEDGFTASLRYFLRFYFV